MRKSSTEVTTKAVTKAEPKTHFVQKVIGGDTYLVMAQSSVELEDEFSNLYYTTSEDSKLFLMPPFEPNVLMNLANTNNILLQCIEAMEVNIDSTGYSFVPVEEGEDVDENEVQIAQDFFSQPYPNESFIKIRRKLRRSMESIGYAYLEVLRNMNGDIVGLRNIETPHVRMVKLDAPVLVKKKVMRNGKEVELTLWERERRYAQRVALKELVYYKEFGASRNVNRETGEWEKPDNPIPPEKQGTELLCFGIHPDVTTPYFLPRWINQLPSVVGSRKAEEQNLQFLDSGGLPPAIIFVQGGTLAKDSSDQLKMYLSGQNKNKYRAAVVEAVSSSGSLDSAGNVQVKVERFGSQAAQDAMFMNYDVNTEEHVRKGFRLPELFVGKSNDFNFACYDEETETLTDHGWVKRKDYLPEMKVAAVDPKTMGMKFEYPTALSTYDVSNVEMYHYKNSVVDMMVTPNHRMRFRTNNSPYRMSVIEEMASLSRTYVGTSVNWSSSNIFTEFTPPYFRQPSKISYYHHCPLPIKANDFLEFMGWYASEGHTLANHAVITQHPNRGLDKVRNLAERFGKLGYLLDEQPLSNGCKQVKFGYYSFAKWLKENVGKGEKKCLPQWILDLPKEQLQILFDALMSGDGTRDNREGRTCMAYSSVSWVLAGQVQEIAFKLGYCASVRTERPGTLGNLPVYRVLISTRKETALDKKLCNRKVYTGKVHCFTVSTGLYVTRRNGKIAIQGNTASVSYMVAEAQVFSPERLAFDEVINKTIMMALGFKTIKMKSNPITMKDVASQLSGLGLVKDLATRESFIKEVNSATGMTLDLAAVPTPDTSTDTIGPNGQVQTQSTAVPGAKTISQTPHEELPASIKPSDMSPQNKTIQIQPPQKKKAMELIDLAHDYAAVKGLVLKREVSPERSLLVKEQVDSLHEEDKDAFNSLLATYTYGNDSADLVQLIASVN